MLFGPNAAGKSNFLDALQLLSKLGTRPTLKEAFAPPYRGKPLESFTVGHDGLKGLAERDRLAFSIEVDLRLSDTIVDAVNREVREMHRLSGGASSGKTNRTPPLVRKRDLRYRVGIEMRPKCGALLVNDEYLAALNPGGKQTGKPKPFIEREDKKIRMRTEGLRQSYIYKRHLNRTILSMPHYPIHCPHLTAVRREFESWLFFYLEPRERMRATGPIENTGHIGSMGEDLAALLWEIQSLEPKQFEAIEKSLHVMTPEIDGIDVDVNDLHEAELRLKESGIAVPARVVSDGTLRILGLLALTGIGDPPSLVGFEEPENGVHPRRIQLIAELLKTRAHIGETQYIVTTHSPIFLDMLPGDSLLAVRRSERRTRIDPFSSWGPLAYHRESVGVALDDGEDNLPVSQRILRGDFDA